MDCIAQRYSCLSGGVMSDGRESVCAVMGGSITQGVSGTHCGGSEKGGSHCAVGCVTGPRPPQERAGRGFLSGSMSESRRAR